MAKFNITNFMSNVGRESWVHRLDPRTKLFILIFFGSIPLLFSDVRFVLFFLALTIPLWVTSNIKFRPMIGPFLGIAVFLTIIFLLNALRGTSVLESENPYTQYEWFYRLGPLVVTNTSIVRGFYLALRLMASLTIGLLVITTTDPTYMGKGMRKLRMPTAVVFMALAGLRFIPIITEQMYNILDALTIRGVGRSTVERTKLLVLPLFITSLRRTRTMGLACEARAFGANLWNEFYEGFKLEWMDKAILISLLLLTAGSLYVRFVLGLGVMEETLAGTDFS